MNSHNPASTTDSCGEWSSAILASDASVRNQTQDDQPNEIALGYRLEATTGNIIEEESIYLRNPRTYNGEAEALAVLAGLYAAQKHSVDTVYIHTDSKGVVDHLTNQHAVENSDSLRTVLNTISRLRTDFAHTTIKQVSRDDILIEAAHNIAHRAFPRNTSQESV